MYQIQKINDLPDIHVLKKRSQGLALLDAIIMPEWENRFFSFNGNWNSQAGEMMASMRNGAGAEYFLQFSNDGVIGKVFDGTRQKDISSNSKEIPSCFSSFLNEAAFDIGHATYFFFRQNTDREWTALPKNLNQFSCLQYLSEGAVCYHKWAENYYGRRIDFQTLEDVYTSLSVTQQQLSKLNIELKLEELDEDIAEIMGAA
jgi:hypothetical protein